MKKNKIISVLSALSISAVVPSLAMSCSSEKKQDMPDKVWFSASATINKEGNEICATGYGMSRIKNAKELSLFKYGTINCTSYIKEIHRKNSEDLRTIYIKLNEKLPHGMYRIVWNPSDKNEPSLHVNWVTYLDNDSVSFEGFSIGDDRMSLSFTGKGLDGITNISQLCLDYQGDSYSSWTSKMFVDDSLKINKNGLELNIKLKNALEDESEHSLNYCYDVKNYTSIVSMPFTVPARHKKVSLYGFITNDYQNFTLEGYNLDLIKNASDIYIKDVINNKTFSFKSIDHVTPENTQAVLSEKLLAYSKYELWFKDNSIGDYRLQEFEIKKPEIKKPVIKSITYRGPIYGMSAAITIFGDNLESFNKRPKDIIILNSDGTNATSNVSEADYTGGGWQGPSLLLTLDKPLDNGDYKIKMILEDGSEIETPLFNAKA